MVPNDSVAIPPSCRPSGNRPDQPGYGKELQWTRTSLFAGLGLGNQHPTQLGVREIKLGEAARAKEEPQGAEKID